MLGGSVKKDMINGLIKLITIKNENYAIFVLFICFLCI